MNDNFTQLPNDLIKVLMSQAVSKKEAAVLLLVARKTYGYHRKTACISKREFNEELGISIRGIRYILSRLELVKLLALVNKGNSRFASSEWLIDLSNYPEKLVKLSALVKFVPERRKRLVKHASSTGEAWYSKIASLNKDINKAAAVDAILSSKSNAELRGTDLYVGGKKINNPVSYWQAIQENSPALVSTPVEKPAKEMTDQELRDYFSGKKIGIDEDIPQDYVYEALERKIL